MWTPPTTGRPQGVHCPTRMHYRTNVNAVDYMSTTGRSLPDLTLIMITMTHSWTAALPHQSPHCVATQVWVSVVECGEPVQHPKCQLVTMQLPGNHRDQNVILISPSALHWAVIIGNVAEMSSEMDLCIWDCPACFYCFPWHSATPFNWRGRCHNTVYIHCLHF